MSRPRVTPKHPQNPPTGKVSRRLAKKSYSFRLPVPVAAKFEALCELHPKKSRRQIAADLLALGLAETQRASTQAPAGSLDYHPDTRQPIYLLRGPFAEFRGLVHKHHHAITRELGDNGAELPGGFDDYALDDAQ